MKRAYYQKPISEFLKAQHEEILGELAKSHPFALEPSQRNAWLEQISNLKEQLAEIQHGEVFFEFSIPRMGKRADVILLMRNIVFVLEYKVGATEHARYAIDQAYDYTLDLKNFHKASHNKYIVPLLISTAAPERPNFPKWGEDNVCSPLLSNGKDLRNLINLGISTAVREQGSGSSMSRHGFGDTSQDSYEAEKWSDSGYKPTPTIIEAAQALYKKHSVDDISRTDADIKNLTDTTTAIHKIIEHSKSNHRKSICFITGVPGAGKTLAGLNISIQKLDASTGEQAVFLSGNGPLVAVLREALARDEVERAKEQGQRTSKDAALRKVRTFIQNIHHFRDHYLTSEEAPDHVVVFDEAQRAWNQAKLKQFMAQKKGRPNFGMSEPEFLISVMNRRTDWCTMICLIGGGQEINTGEAGLIEWFNALQSHFPGWDVYHSGQLSNKSYNWGENLQEKLKDLNAVENKDLHLAVSIRSYRAEKLSDFVSAIIDGNSDRAEEIAAALSKYPLVITRDLNKARRWLKDHARGSERLGLLASSGAMRLKPEGIMVNAEVDPVNWFLNGKEDVRSSYYLEDVGTEFDVQGLELDWAGVCWDADFRRDKGSWSLYNFKGTRWQTVNDHFRKVYLANAYRVLLTRARQGMVIFVPKGDVDDPTRPPKFYNETYTFLMDCGFRELP